MPPVDPARAQPPLVLVLDAGTSSFRAAVYDARARPVTGWSARAEHSATVRPDGGAEFDPTAVLDIIAGLVDQALAAAGQRAQGIAAVGMASLAATLLAVDASGAPLTPVYLYSDTRPASAAAELRRRLDEAAVHARTGCRLQSSYAPALLLWLSRAQPEAFGRAARWLSLPEFIYGRLFGEYRCGYAIAAWSGLLNGETLDWDEELLTFLGVGRERLSPLGEASLSGLRPQFARRWPALASVPWFPAWADGAASNIGSGCASPQEMALSLGTTGALRVVATGQGGSLPSGLWRYRVDRARPLVGGALNEGGGTVAWLRGLLQLADLAAAEAEVAAATPDGHGLTVLPLPLGERSPGWNSDLRAVIAGLSSGTRPADVLQAAMEAVAYRFGLVAAELREAVPGATRMVASGGAAEASPAWLQIIADVLGAPLELSAEAEATSRGVAVLVLEALGAAAAVLPAATSRTFAPNADRHECYAAAMQRQQRLYRAIVDWQETPGRTPRR